MRVTLSSASDTLVLSGRRLGARGDGWVEEQGIDGWFGTPAVRQEPSEAPGIDGSLMPSRLTTAHRVVTVRAHLKDLSEVGIARMCDRLAAMACERLTLTVDGPDGPRSCACYLSDGPEPAVSPRDGRASVALVLTCPDPLKYGPEVPFRAVGGACDVENPGNAPVLPRVEADGPVTSLALSLGGREVRWSGSGGSGLRLDFADMAPSFGRVSVDDAFRVPPGASTVLVSSAGATAVRVYVRGGWR